MFEKAHIVLTAEEQAGLEAADFGLWTWSAPVCSWSRMPIRSAAAPKKWSCLPGRPARNTGTRPFLSLPSFSASSNRLCFFADVQYNKGSIKQKFHGDDGHAGKNLSDALRGDPLLGQQGARPGNGRPGFPAGADRRPPPV